MTGVQTCALPIYDSSDRKPSKPKPKPTEPSTEDPTDPSEPTTEPEKPTEPTEPTTEPEKPTEPTEPSTEPEKPTEPDVKTYRVAYYLPYIALWGENQDGSKYSSIMDIAQPTTLRTIPLKAEVSFRNRRISQ